MLADTVTDSIKQLLKKDCMFATLCTGVGDQKRALTPQELELPAIVSFLTWVLGTKLGSFRKAGSTLNC